MINELVKFWEQFILKKKMLSVKGKHFFCNWSYKSGGSGIEKMIYGK